MKKLNFISFIVFAVIFTGCVSGVNLENIPILNTFGDKQSAVVNAENIDENKILTIFVLDSSGSMTDIDSYTNLSLIESAKKSIKDIVLTLDSEKTNLSLVSFNGGCGAKTLINASNDTNNFINVISNIEADGKTPLANAIKVAGNLAKNSKVLANIIIFSDGLETCNGDPKWQIQNAIAQNPNIKINSFILGYGVDEQTKIYLQSLVIGDGGYYNVANFKELTHALNLITTKLNINKSGWENGVYDFRINFDHDKDIIKPEFIENVQNLANFLLKSGNLVQIQGHTDNVGNSNYNKNLSLKRANAVKKALVSLGVDESKITTIGYGEDLPKVPNTTMENKYKNRRVEAHILR